MASTWTRFAGAVAIVACLAVGTFLTTATSGASQPTQGVAFATPSVAPEPTTTAAPVTTEAPAPPPSVAPAPAPVAPEPRVVYVEAKTEPALPPERPPVEEESPAVSAAERCSAARQWVAAHGLNLPAGFAFRCPDAALFADGASRWGVTCWNCGVGTGSYIAINIDRIGASDETLRYVVAHETCHAIENVAIHTTSEASADACAAAHGAPRP
ncbi:MAG TPA: hypothetical protein VM121_03850 [Acidimicrobiales bacterium]|nr:hypothetical protein [Acidimicrobiales bacterium]